MTSRMLKQTKLGMGGGGGGGVPAYWRKQWTVPLEWNGGMEY